MPTLIKRHQIDMPEINFDLDNVFITPARVSKISSRKEVNPYYNGMLPIFAAPMDTVIDEKNYKYFIDNKINVCLPRTVPISAMQSSNSKVFYSIGLDEFIEMSTKAQFSGNEFLLIDIANGHMQKMLDAIRFAKNNWPTMTIMAGNIANPKTVLDYEAAGADYVRVGIGGGAGCLTATQTGISYAMGSLIAESFKIKKENNLKIKIIADGGMRKNADIIKALALGADYVMIGSLLNQCIESCADNYLSTLIGDIKISPKLAQKLYNKKYTILKKFRGMSTKEVQRKMGKKNLRTSEGVVKYQKVNYTLTQWIDNFESYLSSNMSYTNSFTLSDFIGTVETTLNTTEVFQRINK